MNHAPYSGPPASALAASPPNGLAGWRGWLLPVGALVLGLLMYGYIAAVLVPYQIGGAQATNTPRGNLSDLYPRWLGARELLWHGRNPYSAEVTREIQLGYYGRVLTADDPIKDQQGFAYPLYVVFLLAPLTGFAFSAVQGLFGWGLLALTAASVPLWLRALGWRPGAPAVLAGALLAAGSWPAQQAWALEQLTALVAALLAAAAYCLARGATAGAGGRGPGAGDQETGAGTQHATRTHSSFLWYVAAGALLAVATIKPQLTMLLGAGLALWVVSRWRARQGVAWGFGGMLALLLGGSLLLMPGWPGEFRTALAAYQDYTAGRSILDFFSRILLERIAPAAVAPVTAGLALALVGAAGAIWWQARRAAPGGPVFARALAATLAITLLIIPTWAPYNQLLLIPGMALLVRERAALWALGRWGGRALWLPAATMIGWPWLAAGVLMAWLGVSLARGETCCAAPVYQVGWFLPLITSQFGPPAVLAALAGLWARPRLAPSDNASVREEPG